MTNGDLLEARLAALAPLDAPDRLTRRMRASLLAGVEPHLVATGPVGGSRQRRWPLVAVATAAAVVIVLAWPRRQVRPLDDDAGWLIPRAALAQGAPGLPPLPSLRPERLRPGTWTYQGRTRGPDGFEADLGETRVRVEVGVRGGDSVWVLTRRGPQRVGGATASVDSVVVLRKTLSPVARTRVPSRWTMAFRGDSVAVDLPRRAFHRAWPLPPIDRKPYLVELATLLPAIPFEPGFRAGIPLLAAFHPGGPVVSLEMAVVGEDLVTVPAGTYRCYRVRIGGGAHGDVWWVDTESGRLVKTTRVWGGDMEDETVLLEAR